MLRYEIHGIIVRKCANLVTLQTHLEKGNTLCAGHMSYPICSADKLWIFGNAFD